VLDGADAKIVERASVTDGQILVHDETNYSRGQAFALSRLNRGPEGPAPLGVFLDNPRDTYDEQLNRQLAEVQEAKGPGDLEKLIRSLGTWTVE
jgi:hypothetical protein